MKIQPHHGIRSPGQAERVTSREKPTRTARFRDRIAPRYAWRRVRHQHALPRGRARVLALVRASGRPGWPATRTELLQPGRARVRSHQRRVQNRLAWQANRRNGLFLVARKAS